MAFQWKGHKDIWKGEGIYHLTFAVAGRRPLLGVVKGLSAEEIDHVARRAGGTEDGSTLPWDVSYPDYVAAVKDTAWVELTALGKAVERDISNYDLHHPGVVVCCKRIMDNHLHVVLWVKNDTGKSILQLAHGLRIGLTHIAQDMGVWPKMPPVVPQVPMPPAPMPGVTQELMPGVTRPTDMNAKTGRPADLNAACPADMDAARPADMNAARPADMSAACPEIMSTAASMAGGVDMRRACHAQPGAGLLLDKPFVRTLARKGQLRTMIDYVRLNPYRKWMMRIHPELFTLHHDTRVAGLRFRSMGNHWLLQWPMKQMVECSRSTTQTDWDAQLEAVLHEAETGIVTYTAAVSDGEKYIARKVREAGFPLVVLLKDGFPAEGSEAMRYFKPGGIYFEACAHGRLLLLEAYGETYRDARVVTATENTLRMKAEAKHIAYSPLPMGSRRWRFVAGNEMVRLIITHNA